MPLNAGYEYVNAEKMYARATTLDERIAALEEMIRAAPKHKSSEHHVSELKNRLRRFLEKKEKNKKVGKTTLKSIRKDGFQCVLVGLTNAGKSSLLAKITNARPKISSYNFTTKQPEIGTLEHKGYRAQIVDLPSIGSESYDTGLVNTADCIIIVIDNLEQIEKIEQNLSRAVGKKILVFNKIEQLDSEEKRKFKDKLKSKKINALLLSTFTEEGIEELKGKIVEAMPLIRVYLKEPGKVAGKIPMILPIGATVRKAAESIYKGFSLKIKETKVTGPSSKFPNQKVGLNHILKDFDTIEFHAS